MGCSFNGEGEVEEDNGMGILKVGSLSRDSHDTHQEPRLWYHEVH